MEQQKTTLASAIRQQIAGLGSFERDIRTMIFIANKRNSTVANLNWEPVFEWYQSQQTTLRKALSVF